MSLRILLFATVLVVAGCSSTPNEPQTSPASPATAAAPKDGPPQALVESAEYGENVYDLAKMKDWPAASAKLAQLKDSLRRLPSASPDLQKDVGALEKAVMERKSLLARGLANQITLKVADLQSKYTLAVPIEITKLDYYGRELEVRAEENSRQSLADAAAGLRKTWDAVRPAVEARDRAEAQRFEELVAKIEAARPSRDHRQLAAAVLDKVDTLEKIFLAGH